MRLGRFAVALFLLCTAIGLVRSLPLGWGAADAPDGTRYKVSPLGLSHVLQLHQTVSPTEDCRWGHPDPLSLCAFNARFPWAAHALLSVRWLMWLAAIVAAAGAVAWLVPRPPDALLRLSIPGVALLAALSLGLFAWSVPRASAVLNPLPFGVGGTLGTMMVAVLIALLLGFAAPRMVRKPGWGRRLTGSACAALGLVPFILMFPLTGGLLLALASVGVGAALSWVASRSPRPVPAA